MAKPNQVKIGNEHFKTWLKRLDPAARVEKMSAIAKTQASAGLTGSSIKESLAQLSQRCKVMLIKMTEEDIKRITTRKKRKNFVDSRKEIEHVNSTTLNEKKSTDIVSKLDACSEVKILNNQSIKEVGENNATSSQITCQIREELKEKKSNMIKVRKKRLESNKNKLKERYKELFGEEYVDNVTLSKSQPILNPNQNISDNQVSYLSTTVNVNIYNSSTDNFTDTSTYINCKKRKENSLVSDIANKRLRIDVSLPHDTSNLYQAQKPTTKKSKTKTCVMSNQSKKRKPRSKSKSKKVPGGRKFHPSQIEKSRLLALQNDDEDPVKELWKIFGMQSPTDRSENIIKSYPQTHENSSATNKNGNILQKDEELLKSYPSIDQTVKMITDSKKPSASKSFESKGKEMTINEEVSSKSTIGDSAELSTDQETICKISQTFSLAFTNQDPLSNQDKETNELLSSNMGSTKNQNSRQLSSNMIETIAISDDDDEIDITSPSTSDTNNAVKRNCNESKIGTIRVKNLGLLLDPAKTNSPSLLKNASNDEPVNSKSDVIKKTPNQGISEKSVENRFCDTYKLYFDAFVESNILKLGELLHLAMSDEVRRTERIKRAEQLSSSDLINEEKQRANKDFNEMMILRGKGFSHTLDLILTRFEQQSKVTLFFALFIRIFERATEIDSANSRQILTARNVIHSMLTKCNSTHKDICKVLIGNQDAFNHQVIQINNILKSVRNKLLSKSKEHNANNTVSSNNSSYMHNITEDSSVLATNTANTHSTILPTNSSTVPQAQTQPSISQSAQHVSGRRNSTQRNYYTEFDMSGPPNVTIINSAGAVKVSNPPANVPHSPAVLQKTTSEINISSLLDQPSYSPNTHRSAIPNNEVHAVSRNSNKLATSAKTAPTYPLPQTTNPNNFNEESTTIGRTPTNSEQLHLERKTIKPASSSDKCFSLDKNRSLVLGCPKTPKNPESGQQLNIPNGLHSRLRAPIISPPVFQSATNTRPQTVNIRNFPRFVGPQNIQNSVPRQSSNINSNHSYAPRNASPLLSNMLQKPQTSSTSYKNQSSKEIASNFPKTASYTNPTLGNIHNSPPVESNISSHQMNSKLSSLPPSPNTLRVVTSKDQILNDQNISLQNQNLPTRSILAKHLTTRSENNLSKPVEISALASPELAQINCFNLQQLAPPTLTNPTPTIQANDLTISSIKTNLQRPTSLQTPSISDLSITNVGPVPVTTPSFSQRESSLHTPNPLSCQVSGGAPVNGFMNQQGQPQLSSTVLTTTVVTNNLPSTSSIESNSHLQPDLLSASVAPVQDLPTASHCHPFIRRMPISGKMRMFFGNKN